MSCAELATTGLIAPPPLVAARTFVRQTVVVPVDAEPRVLSGLLPAADPAAPVRAGRVELRRTYAARAGAEGATWLAVTTHVVAGDDAAAAPVLDHWRAVEPLLAALARRAARSLAARAERDSGH